MCIGRDVRGNIKLSLKAVQPKHGSDSRVEVPTMPPTKQATINVWAPVDSNNTTPSNELLSASSEKDDDATQGSSVTCSAPSVVIRSAAECDAQDTTVGKHNTMTSSSSRSSKFSRTATPPKDSATSIQNTRPIMKESHSTARSSSAAKRDGVDKSKSFVQPRNYETSPSDDDASPSARSGSPSLGEKVLAKVYQIRAHGLVLEFGGGGGRGMYKFEVNGRREFEVGEELQVECSSFSSKGIPVFSTEAALLVC